MAEADALSSSVWWNPATAITYLREGSLPAKVNWRSLPDAIKETQMLNTAIQSNRIEVMLVPFGGKRKPSKLNEVQKACIALRFRQKALGGDIGVVLEIVDRHTGKRRRDIKNLELSAEDVQRLRTADLPTVTEAANELLSSAIKKRWNAGERPGSAGKWDVFCDSICDDCDAWLGDRKNRKPKRGFGKRNIQRQVVALRQSGELKV